MSSRGGRGMARARSITDGARQPRPGFQVRARANSARGASIRGNSRGRGNPAADSTRGSLGNRVKTDQHSISSGDPQQRFQQLKKRREEERKQAIRDGFLADPDKPRTLAEAITPVGTCPDMCAEYERLERIVQKDVWSQETREDGSPDELRMVKKFRRAAAGIDEQLPSDLRPPATLKKTCDYLFNDLIGNAEALGTVHHFVWDRTRAIRNDFSIQQITRSTDVEIAVECYERIARFHILSLHQFAVPEKPYDKYDWYQEREQLDRTLLSLMQYYDDNRARSTFKNEPEFRAYCIVFQIQDPIPDLEERVSCYPETVKNHPRVRAALNLYAAACNILDPQGPLKPRAPHPVAREDWNAFFSQVESNRISYLTACVAEIYFNMVRRQTLNGIWRAFRRQGNPIDITDFSLDYLTDLLRFDDPDQTHNFCENYGFGFKELPDGNDEFLDLNSIQGKTFPDAAGGLSAQIFSQSVVENKRVGRTFPAVISGYSVGRSRAEGLIEEIEGADDEEMQTDSEQAFSSGQANSTSPFTSLTSAKPTSPFTGFGASPTTSSNPFSAGPTTFASESKPSGFSFPIGHAPSNSQNLGSTTPAGSPFAPKSGLQDSVFATNKTSSTPAWGKPSNSTWSTPITSTSEASQFKPALGVSPFSQPFKNAEPSNAEPPKSPQPTMTSIHAAPSSPAWKPPTSPWSKPIFSPAASSQPETTAKTAITQLPFSTNSDNPASQQSLPTFSWSKPPEPQAAMEVPGQTSKVSFAAPSNVEKPTEQGAVFSFMDSTSAPVVEAKSTSIFAAKPKADQTAPSSVGGQTSKPDSDGMTSQPMFSFPSSTKAAQENKGQAAEPSKSLFNFPTSSPVAGPSGQQSGGDSSFAPQDPATKSSKPFSFLSQAQPAVQPPSQPPQKAPQGQPQNQPAQPSASQAAPSNSPKAPSLSFSQPNQPKKRSPLSQSYSAEEDQPTSANSIGSMNFDTPPKGPSKIPSTTPASVLKASAAKPSPQTQQKKADLPTILQKLASEIIADPERGLIRQFVEYHARPIIMGVYEQVYLEEMQEIADKFRKEKIAKKYGRRWRETSWKLRLARQGREKREKRRTVRRDRAANDIAKKRRLKEDAVDDFLKRRSIRMQKESVNGQSTATSMAQTERRTSITSISTADVEMASANTDTASRWEKVRGVSVADTVEGRDRRPSKPATPAPSQGSASRRSHFLGFSMPKQRSILGDATPRQSSGSTYFRMKAMGLNPNGTSIASTTMGPPALNLKKRARDDESDLAETSPPHKKSKTPPPLLTNGQSRLRSSSSVSRSSIFQPSPAPSMAASRPQSRALESEDIIARSRAARQSLRQSTMSQQPPSVAPADDAISVASSTAPQSTSLQRARLNARLRAVERAEASLVPPPRSPDVPAYRLRESRFVPREHYSRAIDRARENIERRSRPSSVISVREEAATPTATQVPSMEVETSLTKSASPSARRESNVSQHDDSLAYGISQDVNNQDQLFGFGRFSQPQTPGVATREQFAFQSLDALADASQQPEDTIMHEETIADLMQTEATPLETLSNASQNMPFSQPSLFGAAIDTQTLSASPYLSVGNDLSQDTSRQSSMYPDLTPAFGQRVAHAGHDSQEIPESIHDDHDYLNDAAHQALDIESSATPFGAFPYDAAPLQTADSIVNGSFDLDESREDFPIDPDLLVSSAVQVPEIVESASSDKQPAAEEEIVLETQYEQPKNKGKQVVSKNPFAALADASDHSMDDNSSASASHETADEGDAATPAKHDDEEHFVPNGSIQDAQREPPETVSSFTSTTTHTASFPVNDGPARHTRSHSKEQLQPMKNGRLSLSPIDTTHPAKPRYSLRSSPIVEVPEVEEAEYSSDGKDVDQTADKEAEHADTGMVEQPEDDRTNDVVEEAEDGSDAMSEIAVARDASISDKEIESAEEAEDAPSAEDESEHSYISEDVEIVSEQEIDEDEETAVRHPRSQDAQAPDEGDYYSQSEDGYDEEEEEEEEEGEEEYDSEDDEDGYASGVSRGLTANEMQQSGIVKGGTGQTAEDAFELSD